MKIKDNSVTMWAVVAPIKGGSYFLFPETIRRTRKKCKADAHGMLTAKFLTKKNDKKCVKVQISIKAETLRSW